MLQQLLAIVQETTQDAVVKNQKVPNEINSGVQQEIANSIAGYLKSQVSSGNVNGVVDLLKKGSNPRNAKANPVAGGIIDTIIANVSKKFNLSEDVTRAIAQQAVPLIISTLTKKAANKKDKSIEFTDILGSLMEGNSKSGVDIGSIAQTLMKANSKSGSGDLFGMLGGFLKGK